MGSIFARGKGRSGDPKLLDSHSDRDLAVLAEQGNETAFDLLVQRHRPTLIRKAERLVSTQIAEDVVQQAITKLFVSLTSGQEIINPGAWLHRVTHNLALDHLRSAAHRHADTLPLDADLLPAQAGQLETKQEFDAIVGAIGALPDRERHVLVETAVAGKSNEQLAGEMGITPKNVGVIKHRARARLRKMIGLLIPIPLLRLFGHAPDRPAKAAGLASGAGGSGGAIKLAVIGAAGVAVVGAGVSLREHDRRDQHSPQGPVAAAMPASHHKGGGQDAVSKPGTRASGPGQKSGHGNSHPTSGPAGNGPHALPGDDPGQSDPQGPGDADRSGGEHHAKTLSKDDRSSGSGGKDEAGSDNGNSAQAAHSVTISGTTMRILGSSPGADYVTINLNSNNQYVVSETNSPSTFNGDNGCSRSPTHPKNILCAAGGVSSIEVSTGDGDDTIKVLSGSIPAAIVIDAGAGADQINTRNGNDNVTGGPGNDSIDVGGGDNVVSGGGGDDRISADHGADVLDGGDGNDDIEARSGNDRVDAGAGDDVITPGLGEDTVAAGPGQDRLSGQDHQRDQLDCGSGIDILGRVDRIDTLIACES